MKSQGIANDVNKDSLDATRMGNWSDMRFGLDFSCWNNNVSF